MTEPHEQSSDLHVFSFLSREDTKRLGGLPRQAIVGLVTQTGLDSNQFTPETFKPNAAFREFLHETLAQCGLASPRLEAQARRIGDGYVYIIDARTPGPDGKVAPEDIIGSFKATRGQLVSGSYQANADHRIISDRGLFRLSKELQACLTKTMRNLPPVSTNFDVQNHS